MSVHIHTIVYLHGLVKKLFKKGHLWLFLSGSVLLRFMVTLQTALHSDLGTVVIDKISRAWIYIGFQSKRAVHPITLS